MIKLQTIEVEEFRGIRKMELQLNKQSFGICGPNGTGKSGVVDAIEFALTGDITRLSGLGSAELSVKVHGPHVDARNTPGKSRVKITALAPALNCSITIERSVAAPNAAVITPDNPKTRAFVAMLGTHPEFALSRREIVKYILTPAGQRSKDVQTLLRLDQLETVRQSLVRVANDAKKQSTNSTSEDERAKREFLQHLGLKALSKVELLAAVNTRRAILQLAPIADLKGNVSLKEGVVAQEGKEAPKTRVVKATSLVDTEALIAAIAAGDNEAVAAGRASALEMLKALQADPVALNNFKRRMLVEQGLALLDDDACPLCDNPWDSVELAKHLQAKLAVADAALQELKKLQTALQPVIDNCADIVSGLTRLAGTCGLLDPKIDPAEIEAYKKLVADAGRILSSIAENPALIADALVHLESGAWKPSAAATTAITDAHTAIKALPEPSDQDKARDYLTVAQERYDRCTTTRKAKEEAEVRSTLAATVSKTYNDASTKVLEGVYAAVEKDFTEYYRLINSDDEQSFEGRLTPSPAKLAFDVDFYGRGKSPPGAYHSEGHQDAMGLCLYLALMKHTMGEQFTFAVLDDVLMSVDTGHRREVCALLRSQFPKTQFVLTTHDPIWLQYMRTQQLIQSSVSFGSWSVETGPLVWNEGDVWEQIDEKLAKNDVPGAAATMRRYLEYVTRILADDLRAAVEFQGDGVYDLGDLLPPVIRTWKDLGSKAKEACVSFGQDVTKIEEFRKNANQKIAGSMGEQWLLNKAVHFNEWAALEKKDFQAVANAFRELIESMQCVQPQCRSFLKVAPAKGPREALRCDCGDTNFNLKVKE